MLEIIPTILTSDPKEVEEEIRRFEGKVERVQIDILDGVFANNRTIGLEIAAGAETSLLFDVHLMTKEPALWVERSLRAMADRIIGHVEMMSDQVGFVGKVQEAGLKVGLGLDLGTQIDAIEPTIMMDLDVVLVMSVKAGFGGQEFDHSVLKKIRELDEVRTRDDTPFRICVDGGINAKTIKQARQAGADEVAVGSALEGGELAGQLDELMKAAYAG